MAASLGGYIAELRRSRRLTQRVLARKLGVGSAYISQIERGRRLYIGPEMTAKLCDALELNEAELNQMQLMKSLAKGYLPLPPATTAQGAALVGLIARIAEDLTDDQIMAFQGLVLALAQVHAQGEERKTA
jgi:transcriptional regulator with XRE-family HTH domain